MYCLEGVWRGSGKLAPNAAVHGGGAPAAFDPGRADEVSRQGFDTSFRSKGLPYSKIDQINKFMTACVPPPPPSY